MTTSGVGLQSPSGAKYITVAKHGFPGGVGDRVLHLNRSGQVIAEVAKVFGETDIALARLAIVLHPRETFPAVDVPVRLFGSLSNITQARVGDLFFEDNPFDGGCEGVLAKVDVWRIPADEPANAVGYVFDLLKYFGQWSRHFV